MVKTAELRLSLDLVNVSYATVMNEKSIFKKLYKVFLFQKYDVNKYIEDGKIKKLFF